MATGCGQVVIPTTDETPIPCNEMINSDCIIHAASIAYLALEANSTMTEVISAMMSSLIDSRNRVELLETSDAINKNGVFDYNDLATTGTPIAITGGAGFSFLTNDGAGANTNINYPPTGVIKVWDTALNEFDFSELNLGAKIEIRLDIEVITTTPNTDIDIVMELAIGGGTYDISWETSSQKSAGTYQLVTSSFIYIGDANTKDNPAKFKVKSDENITVKVNGWACYINNY